jgi:uncharacterized protein
MAAGGAVGRIPGWKAPDQEDESMIHEKIQEDIKTAMRARDAIRLGTLRFLHSEIKNIGINEKVAITDEITLKVIGRLAKQRREGIEEFRKAGRPDLVAKEEAELAILEAYLPKGIGEEELKAEVAAVIAEVGATSKKDMGKVMKAAMARLAGRADGKAIQAAAASLLP